METTIRLLCLLLCITGCEKKPQVDACKDKSSTTILDEKIQQIMDRYHVPGLAMVIIEHGNIRVSKVYGVKNTKTRELVDENTLFEAASLGKPVFAYGVLKLVERGQLDLDKPLSEYLVYDDIKNDPKAAAITARMVLSHTTGLPNWRKKNLETYFKPGERFSYSGEGFVYLQKVVEKISGQPIETYMQENVFRPLGMKNSSYILPKEHSAKATGHDKHGRGPSWFSVGLNKIFDWLRLSQQSANVAASLHTTALDYAKFVQAIIKNSGLQSSTIDHMLFRHSAVGINGPTNIENYADKVHSTISWGLGWGLQETQKGASFWHWGNNPCFKNYIFGFKNGTAMILFTNGDNGMKAIKKIVYDMTGICQPAFDWLNN